MRAHPNGGGDVVRVVPRGTVLRIFAEAPGGWLQLGATAPEGWVHASMITRTGAPAPAQTIATASR
nr:SH3 domain-containing protein [Pseudoroseomonas aerophila]